MSMSITCADAFLVSVSVAAGWLSVKFLYSVAMSKYHGKERRW